jgi:hypothetical protein
MRLDGLSRSTAKRGVSESRSTFAFTESNQSTGPCVLAPHQLRLLTLLDDGLKEPAKHWETMEREIQRLLQMLVKMILGNQILQGNIDERSKVALFASHHDCGHSNSQHAFAYGVSSFVSLFNWLISSAKRFFSFLDWRNIIC